MSIPVNLVFEDEISEFVMFKLLYSFGDKYFISNSYSGNGYGYIKQNINGFNQASLVMPHFILTDLDNYDCPINLINAWEIHTFNQNLIFRIAVREVESWLLADIEGFSKFTGVSKANLSENPDMEGDPKGKLMQVVKRSRKRTIKEDILPIDDNARIGPNYNGRLMMYVSENWSVERAIENSDSLKRAFKRLEGFTYGFH